MGIDFWCYFEPQTLFKTLEHAQIDWHKNWQFSTRIAVSSQYFRI